MDKYLLIIWVTIEQERTIRDTFIQHRWLFQKEEGIKACQNVDDVIEEVSSINTSQCPKHDHNKSSNVTHSDRTPQVSDSKDVDNNEDKRQVSGSSSENNSFLTSCENDIRKQPKPCKFAKSNKLKIKLDSKGTSKNGRSKKPVNKKIPKLLDSSDQRRIVHEIEDAHNIKIKQEEPIGNARNTEIIIAKTESSEKLKKSNNGVTFPKSEINQFYSKSDSDDYEGSEGSVYEADTKAIKVPDKKSIVENQTDETETNSIQNNSGKAKSSLIQGRRPVKKGKSKKLKRKEEKMEEIKSLVETIIKEGKVDIDIGCEDGKSVCPYCNREFTNRFSFLKHVQRHAKNAFDCPDCGRTFNNLRNLHSHRFNRSGSKIFQCDICDFAGNTACLLRWHRKHQHQPENEFQCHLCAKVIKTKSYLKVHMKTVHNIDEAKYLYECHICGTKAIRMCNYKRHMQLHKEEEGFSKCNECGKEFKTRKLLNCHMRYHRDRRFLCDYCGKGFTTRSKLGTHYRTHTGDKPFTCSVCDFKTTQQGNLRLHMKVHSKNNDTERGEVRKVQTDVGVGNYGSDNVNIPSISALARNPDSCPVLSESAYSSLPQIGISSSSICANVNLHTSIAEQSDGMVNVVYSDHMVNLPPDKQQYQMNTHIPSVQNNLSNNNNNTTLNMQTDLLNNTDNMSYQLADSCVANIDLSMADSLMQYSHHHSSAGFLSNHVSDPTLSCSVQPTQMVQSSYSEQNANSNLYSNVSVQMNFSSCVNSGNLDSAYAHHASHSHPHPLPHQNLQADYSGQMTDASYNKSSMYSNTFNSLDYNESYHQSMYDTSHVEFSKSQMLPHSSNSRTDDFANQTGSVMPGSQPKMVSMDFSKTVYQSTMMQDMSANQNQGYQMATEMVYSQYAQNETSMMGSMDQGCINYQHTAQTSNQFNTMDSVNVMGVASIFQGEKNLTHDQIETSEHYSIKQEIAPVYDDNNLNVL